MITNTNNSLNSAQREGRLAETSKPTIENVEKVSPIRYPLGKSRHEKRTISVFGLGYVGTVSMACFSELGHKVIGVDPNLAKVNALKAGEPPILEEHLPELLAQAKRRGLLNAMQKVKEAVRQSEISLVSVGTPSRPDGSCDLTYLETVARQTGEALATKTEYHLVIFRSTVPPMTTRQILIPILERASGLTCGQDFGVAFNPEFLRESTAVEDFRHPPKTVIGASDYRAENLALSLYSTLEGPKVATSIECAEFVKYVDNTWHALKVGFGNEIGRVCKAVGIDSHEVMDIFLQDTKLNISGHYLKPGFAYGGSCLPKDVRGMNSLANHHNVEIPIIEQINNSNESHLAHTESLLDSFDGECLGIVGLTFKPGTDDVRESPSLALLKKLMFSGKAVLFFDPCVNKDIVLDKDPEINKKLHECSCENIESLVKRSEKILVAHDSADAYKAAMLCDDSQTVLDVVNSDRVRTIAKRYEGICW